MRRSSGGVYIIAEIGINHNGNMDNCVRMIDAALDAGCSAAKFQLFRAETTYPRSAGAIEWKDRLNRKYRYDIYKASKKYEMPRNWINKLVRRCAERKIDFLCSVSDKRCLDILCSEGIGTVKLPSYATTNIPFIEYCAGRGLKMIMSTGGSMLGEVEEAVSAAAKYNARPSLLHCSIRYPTPLNRCNLGAIETLKMVFPDLSVGYSDHTRETSAASIQAVYLGASIIEKHITLDKNMKGPDHFFALEPRELKKMVMDIRKAETDLRRGCFEIDRIIYGNRSKVAYPHERYLRDFAFMRLFAGRDIKAGQVIRSSDIEILRPGKKGRGLEPKYLRLFEKNRVIARGDISFEDPITWDMIA